MHWMELNKIWYVKMRYCIVYRSTAVHAAHRHSQDNWYTHADIQINGALEKRQVYTLNFLKTRAFLIYLLLLHISFTCCVDNS